MNAPTQPFKPAAELAQDNPVRIPNESAEYRVARRALLAEEIELRRHIERVAAQRRALPPGGPVTGDYRFQDEDGPTDFVGLFGDKQTLAIYSYMFGPERPRPCPMCTNTLGAWEGNAADIGQRISLAVVARSPIERLTAWKEDRGGATFASTAISTAPIRATISASCRTAPRSRPSTCSPAETGRYAISGQARWRTSQPTRARTRVARPTRLLCGRYSTARRRVAARIGIRSSNTSSGPQIDGRERCA